MQRGQRNEVENYNILHNQHTEPVLDSMTAPISTGMLPQESRWRRFLHGLGKCCTAIVRKINQLLAFALVVLLLLLLTRFLLLLLGVSTGVNLFTQAVFTMSDPLIAPFDHLFEPIPYEGYSIDVTTSIAIVVYIVSVVIVRQFLKLLVSKPK